MCLSPHFPSCLSSDGKMRQWNGFLSSIRCRQSGCPKLILTTCGSIEEEGGRRRLMGCSVPSGEVLLEQWQEQQVPLSPSLRPAQTAEGCTLLAP